MAPVDMAIEGETWTLAEPTWFPVSGGLHHKFHSEGGMTFMEAVVPVPLDGIPDKTADLVQHVAG